MTQSEMPSLIDELLGRRCEYFSHGARRTPGDELPLGETDYALAWYLLARLRISSLHVDHAGVAALFHEAAPAAGMPRVTVSMPTDETSPAQALTGAPFGPLYLFSPANKPSAGWLAGAAAESSLALCYGLTGVIDAALVETLQVVSRGCEEAVFVPLSAIAPPLWRAASVLIARRSRQTVLAGVIRQLSVIFCGDDLDALRLAEENLTLRFNYRELDELKSLAATLETQVASLRRTALAQEEMIAELRRTGSQVESRAKGNGRQRVAGR